MDLIKLNSSQFTRQNEPIFCLLFKYIWVLVFLTVQQIIMINPFISNNDNNYLFRKNYQFVAKPQISVQPQNYSTSKLNILQSKNPFMPSTTPNIASTFSARSLSNSRVGINSPQNKGILGKNKLLDEADGWKRQIEYQQRQKLQTYGAEGLRYNAYSTYSPKSYDYKPVQHNRFAPKQQQKRERQERRKQNNFNDYYQSARPIEYSKPPSSARENGYQLKPAKAEPQINNSRKQREHFVDEIYEEQVKGVSKRQKNKYELEVDPIFQESGRKSKLADMFGSAAMSNGFKSVNYHEHDYYNPDQFVQSKRSKFAADTFQKIKYLQQSAVRNFEVNGPPTLTMFGKTYYRIKL